MQDADYQPFPESVEEELRLGNKKTQDIDENIANTLETMNLLNFRENHPQALLGGQKQHVTI